MKTSRLTIIEWGTSLALTGLVLWLMMMRLQSPGGLWRDEAACVQLATMPTLTDVWNHFEHEAFPPPIPLLIRGYVSVFGTGTFALRFFGFLISCSLLASIWYTSWLLQRQPPLVSLALLGLNSSILIWTGALRGYGLACVFIPLAFALTARLMQQTKQSWWLLALLATVCSVQCTLQNSLLVLAIGLSASMVLVCQSRFRSALIVLTVGACSAVTLAPYLPRYSSAEWKKIVEGGTLLIDYIHGFLFDLGRPRVEMAYVWLAFAVIATIGCGVCLWRRRTVQTAWDLVGYGLLVATLSITFYFIFLTYLRYRPRPWHYLPLVTLLACDLEMILTACLQQSRLFRYLRVTAACAVAISFVQPTLQVLNVRLTNLDVAADILEEQANERDLIVVSPWYYGVGFRWHYLGSTPWVTLPILGDLPVHRYDQVVPRLKSPSPLADLKEQIQDTLVAGGRVWIVGDLLPVPPTGPTLLKPAPDPVAGWNEELYIASWMEQLTDFMQRHSRRVVQIELKVPEPVAGAEDVSLWVSSGWK